MWSLTLFLKVRNVGFFVVHLSDEYVLVYLGFIKHFFVREIWWSIFNEIQMEIRIIDLGYGMMDCISVIDLVYRWVSKTIRHVHSIPSWSTPSIDSQNGSRDKSLRLVCQTIKQVWNHDVSSAAIISIFLAYGIMDLGMFVPAHVINKGAH